MNSRREHAAKRTSPQTISFVAIFRQTDEGRLNSNGELPESSRSNATPGTEGSTETRRIYLRTTNPAIIINKRSGDNWYFRNTYPRRSLMPIKLIGAVRTRFRIAYLFWAKSQTEQLRYMPPEIPMERFFIRLTMRVAFPHCGQGGVSASSAFFARSAVFAFSAIGDYSFQFCLPPGCRTASARTGK